MRLIARVERSTGAASHFEGTVGEEGSLEATELPVPSTVAIEERDGGWFLLYIDENGECLGDTWHLTVEDAKEQAAFEFGIADPTGGRAPEAEVSN